MTRSLSLMIPAPMGHDANRMFGALGRGSRNFSVLCYAAGRLMIGLHDWDSPEKYTAPPVPDGGWEAHGLTPTRVTEITTAMVVSDQPYSGPVSHEEFADLAGAQGVTWGEMLPDLPAPGSMATVTAGEFYRTEQEHFPVVKVVQTHVRDNPAHDDLRELRALFAVQPDPFNPAPWVQPLGAHDAYQTTNLIGGPQLVTHDGQTWRCAIASNVWAPGVAGWEIWT